MSKVTEIKLIPYGHQNIDQSDIDEVLKSLNGDFLTTGPLVSLFEENLTHVTGAPTISVSSGTAALHCAFKAIGLEEGDEVITPPLTFIATQAAAALCGASIVFSDVDESTGNIDPNYVESVITSKTKAIVAVDFAGHPAELDELYALASKHNIFLIEDAAHSFGSTYKGRPIGSIADLTTFSFYPTKNITTGEGGAISSNNPELLERARKFARQGIVRKPSDFLIQGEGPWHQEVHDFGLNYRLPDILCALGISQLRRLSQFKIARREVYEKYNSFFGDFPELIIPTKKEYVDPMWHLYPLRVPSSRKLALFHALMDSGFQTQVNYIPAHVQPVFSKFGYTVYDYPNAYDYYKMELSLPIFADRTQLTDARIEEISKIVISSVTK